MIGGNDEHQHRRHGRLLCVLYVLRPVGPIPVFTYCTMQHRHTHTAYRTEINMDDYRAEKGGGAAVATAGSNGDVDICRGSQVMCDKGEEAGDENEDSQPEPPPTMAKRNKRMKTTSPFSLHLTDLPDAVLADAATYLSKPSRALFAVAMTAPSASWAKFNCERRPSAASRAIISSSSATKKNPKEAAEEERWGSFPCSYRKNLAARLTDDDLAAEQPGTLDFEDIEKDLAAGLTDDDLGAILLCINAKNTLKILKLTGCINIIGNGLEPLRGSIVLQQIDLSLVGRHESPIFEPDPSISETAVLPILNSIIDADGQLWYKVLKHIQLPHLWRKNQSSLLEEFMERYNALRDSQQLRCSKCTDRLRGDIRGWMGRNRNRPQDEYGLQNFTCYNCFDLMCYDCDEDGPLKCCSYCDKDFCPSCARMDTCSGCSKNYCKKCFDVYDCAGCDRSVCGNCCELERCKECGKACEYCKLCASGDEFYCQGIMCSNEQL